MISSRVLFSRHDHMLSFFRIYFQMNLLTSDYWSSFYCECDITLEIKPISINVTAYIPFRSKWLSNFNDAVGEKSLYEHTKSSKFLSLSNQSLQLHHLPLPHFFVTLNYRFTIKKKGFLEEISFLRGKKKSTFLSFQINVSPTIKVIYTDTLWCCLEQQEW